MIFTVLLALCGQAILVNCFDKGPHGIIPNTTKAHIATDFLAHLDVYLRERHYAQFRHMLDLVEPDLVHTDSDRQCLHLLKTAFLNPLQHEWSARLLDSSGSLFAPGLMSGTYTSFGDFDACLAIDGEHQTDSVVSNKIRGKHCFATVRLPMNATSKIDYRYANMWPQGNYSWPSMLAKKWTEIDVHYHIAHSLCLPSQCREGFIREIILHAFKPLHQLSVDVQFCQTEKSAQYKLSHWSPSLILVSAILGGVSFLVGIGTILDACSTPNYELDKLTQHSLSHRLLTSFSVLSNGRDLFSVQRTGKYEWLDGIRCMLTMIILFSHVSVNQSVLQFIPLLPLARFPDDIIKQSSSYLNRYLVNSTFCVKSYFLISGFLLSVNFMQKRRLQSFARYLVCRWIRFTPSLLGYVSICVALGLVGHGPLFHSKLIAPYVRPCVDQLWMQLLYINNWFDFRYSCGFQTWYISADLQLYLLAYVVIVLVNRQRWLLSYAISTFFIALSYLIPFYIFAAGIQGIPAFLSVIYPQLSVASRGYLFFWTSSQNHMEAYFGGFLLGIVVGKKMIVSLSESKIRFLWNMNLIILPLVPQMFPWFLKSDLTKSVLDLENSHSWFDALVMTGQHSLWLVLFSWLIYSASVFQVQLKSNRALRFFSAPIFAPFARLCFCAYLMHVPLTWFNVHSARFPQMQNPFGATQFILMTYFNTLGAAMFLHLFFEAPFTKASQVLFNWYDGSKKPKPIKASVELTFVMTAPQPSFESSSTKLNDNSCQNENHSNEK